MAKSAASFGTPDAARENFRQAAVFLARAVHGKSQRAFVFASSTSGEGATTAVVETARQLRDALNLRPLVVEFNNHNPRLSEHQQAGHSGATLVSLADVGVPLDDAIQSGPHELPVIVRGTADPERAQTGALQTALGRVVNESTDRYDVVLVDAPAVLPYADALAACAVIPRLVLVVGSGQARYEMLERVQEDLQEQGVELSGTILNRQKRIIPNWFYNAFLR